MRLKSFSPELAISNLVDVLLVWLNHYVMIITGLLLEAQILCIQIDFFFFKLLLYSIILHVLKMSSCGKILLVLLSLSSGRTFQGVLKNNF